jgi:membrane complex biogenesis BtpA family protein
VRDACPSLPLGINVLRNDAESALGIAVASGAACIRVNVHVGARVTDQGLVQGRAAETMRMRRALSADHVQLWADVDVKHSAALAPRDLTQEAQDTALRGMADALLVTGDGTGKSVDLQKLGTVAKAVPGVPVLVASGSTVEALGAIAQHAHGVIVGSALREGGVAGGPILAARAEQFAKAFRAAFRS